MSRHKVPCYAYPLEADIRYVEVHNGHLHAVIAEIEIEIETRNLCMPNIFEC